MDVYDRLNGLLAEKRITKRKLSIDLQIPYSTLASMFQRRSMSVDIETIKKIASYLDTTIEYLATGNENYKFKYNAPLNTIKVTTGNNETFSYSVSDENIIAIKTILETMSKEKRQWM